MERLLVGALTPPALMCGAHIGRQAVPDVEVHRLGPLHVALGKAPNELLVPLDRGAPVARELEQLSAADEGTELFEDRLESAISESGDGDHVKLVVRIQGRRQVIGVERLREAVICVTHPVDVVSAQLARGLTHGQPVHRGNDIPGVTDRLRIDRADRRRPAGHGNNQAARSETQQSLAHRGSADSEPLREISVAQLLPRLECAVHNGVAKTSIHVVTKKGTVYA